MADEIGKGSSVRITAGRNEGSAGVVFWEGPNKFGPGKRYGVRGADGETYWVSEGGLERRDEPPPADALKQPAETRTRQTETKGKNKHGKKKGNGEGKGEKKGVKKGEKKGG